MKTNVIMFAGGIGSGKGFISNKKSVGLKEVGNLVISLSFADPIKKFIDQWFGYDKHANVFDEDVRNESILFHNVRNFLLKSIPIDDRMKDEKFLIVKKNLDRLNELKRMEPGVDIIREAYQLFGTEVCHSFDLMIWPRIASQRIIELTKKIDGTFFKDVYFIIDDLRYLMEFFGLVSLLPGYNIQPYLIEANMETRCKRRNCTLEEMKVMEQHPSEQDYKKIKEFLLIKYPGNIIDNSDVTCGYKTKISGPNYG